MSDRYRLIAKLHARPTPAGAYHAVAAAHPDPRRRILLGMLGEATSPKLDIDVLRVWVGEDTIDDDALLALLCDAQEQGWVEGLADPDSAPDGPMAELLDQLLPPLSANGTVMLVDAHGFVLSSHGFTDAAAEALGALSADLANLHARHHDAFRFATGLSTSAWAVVDGAGNSQIGFWPLHIGDQRFVLAVAGLPRMNHPQLTRLIWALALRYGAASAHAA